MIKLHTFQCQKCNITNKNNIKSANIIGHRMVIDKSDLQSIFLEK